MNYAIFPGKVDFVKTPTSLEATLSLGLGVFVRKYITVEGAPFPTKHADRAQHACITLCQGKNCLFETADRDRLSECLACRVYVPAKNIPDDLVFEHGGKNWLDLAMFLSALHADEYKIDRVFRVLNGSLNGAHA